MFSLSPTRKNISSGTSGTLLLDHEFTLFSNDGYAESAEKKKVRYRHKALCGIFNTDATEEQLVEAYLQEKYNL